VRQFVAMCIIILFVVSACNSTTSISVPLATVDATDYPSLTVGDLNIRIDSPPSWEFYADSNHLVLTEHDTPVSNDNTSLNGAVINIWLPKVTNGEDGEPHSMHDMLTSITQNLHDHDQLTSDLIPFEWQSHNAIYYVLNSGDGNATFITIIELPQTETHFLGINASIAYEDWERLEDVLPDLLASLRVNDVIFDGDTIEDILRVASVPE